MDTIDYDALKKRGFLRQKQDGFFLLRTRSSVGNYSADQITALIEISKEFARGIVHATTRQGLEIPFIKFEDIENVERKIIAQGVQVGTSGPRIRATTCCPGNNWCKRGLINTFELYEKIENELNIRCGLDLPHKFKIAISGCPNKCTWAQASDIGIHGQIDTSSPDKKIGYAVYLGGCGGMTPQMGFKLDKVFTLEEVLSLIERVVIFYKNNARFRQRLGLLIKEVGITEFLKKVLD